MRRRHSGGGGRAAARSHLAAAPTPTELKVLRKSALLSGAPAESAERLARLAAVEAHKRGRVIYGQGDPADRCYVVLTGRVRAARVESVGREVVIGHRLAGSVVGEGGLVGHKVHGDTAQVAHDAKLLVVPVD